MAACLIALGSNVGDRVAQLERAIRRLDERPSITVVGRSKWFHTDPVGGPSEQGQFVNAAIRVQTSLSPEQLFLVLREVETDLGRQRRERWAARSVDLDLLLFDDHILKTPQLEIPHPRLVFRRFVLEPAAEVARDMFHPVVGWTIGQLLDHLNQAPDYVALAGLPGVGKTALAREAAKQASVRLIEDPAEEPLGREDAARNTLALEREILQRRAKLLEAVSKPGGRGSRRAETAEKYGSAGASPSQERVLKCVLSTAERSQESVTAVSDFWIGQSLAYGRLGLSHDDCAEVENAWRAHEDRIGSPKLLVFLDAPVGWLTERVVATAPSSLWDTPDQLENLRSELSHVVFHARRGPVLQLDATQPAWALTELTAAIEAMS